MENKKKDGMITSAPLGFFTGHVQGIALTESYLFLTAVEEEEKTGYLFKADKNTYQLLAQVKFRVGNIYHPGGISYHNGYILLPLAAYKAQTVSIIFKIDPENLQPAQAFIATDHIGAVTSNGDYIFGMNWDAKDIYIWDSRGKLLKKIRNRRHTAYQDIEYHNGKLYCSGIRRGTSKHGKIDVYRFHKENLELSLEKSIAMPEINDKHSIAKEGMTLQNGYLYFVPEDFPSTRLYRVKIEE